MKNLKYLLFIITLLAVTVAKAQDRDARSLSGFDEVSVSEAITLYLVPGNTNEAVIETNNVDTEEVLTEISGDRLKIHMEGGKRYRDIDVTVTLTYRTINRISVSSAADLYTRGPVSTDDLRVSVSSAGDAIIEVDTDRLEVDVSSSGELEISGRAEEQEVSVSSAGKYEGYEVESKRVEVNASSAGKASVYASDEIHAEASSAGSIRYRGNPVKEYTHSSSGGSVKGN